jgi:4-diphosphocytidyl-2-C-methyl-D-erythritol kinase
VIGRRADGYHLLDSLFAFADIGDRVSASPSREFSLTVDGPHAAEISALGEDNLVLRTARWFAARTKTACGAALRLDKQLPVASGIGGGSADAAAALRVLSRLWNRPLDDQTIRASAELGADVPACIVGRPCWVGGIGEEVEPASQLPELGIVLVNPRHPLPTPAVFRARHGAFGAAARFDRIPVDATEFVALLAGRRNDLADAAISLMPEIAAILDRLECLPGALLARMSGSGATCFALFRGRIAACRAADLLAQEAPGWWSASGSLLSDAAAVIDADQPRE